MWDLNTIEYERLENENNLRQVFNKVYAKYQRKDYFSDKALIKSKLEYVRQFNLNLGKENIVIKYSDIKNFLKSQKQKAYNMILKRIEERKQGKHFPQREKFTLEIFNKLGI